MGLIEPRTLKGFRDYPPALMIPRERVLQTARDVYRSFGFAPIDTPAMEYAEVLLGKGGEESDRIVYRFRDHGDRDVALRFDLTVPFARFSAQHINELGTPFKRYAMGPVWRGENTGAGRYREFWQCDFDIIGTTSNAADIEIALVICSLFDALKISNYKIRINNRLVLNGVLSSLNLAEKSVQILRAIDKLPKVGWDAVNRELCDSLRLSAEQSDQLRQFAAWHQNDHPDEVLAYLSSFGSETEAGVRRLRELLDSVKAAGVNAAKIQIDPSIARGLDYYTGTVYETFLDDLPAIGSVCSGGRYDNLASLYTKQILPGVGASLGVDRLLAAMEELQHPWMTGASTPAPVLMLNLDLNRVGDYQRIAKSVRNAGVGVEVYPEAKKLGTQFQYAEKRGFQLAVIAGEDELASGTVKLKHLARREEQTIDEADLPGACRLLLGLPPQMSPR